MVLDIEKLKFFGMIVSTVEDEFGASVYDDADSEFQTRLHEEYIVQGKPENPRSWIRKEVEKHFQFLVKPPAWIERTTIPRWPFLSGKPMVFIEQVSVPDTELAQGTLCSGAVLYIFGARKPVDDVPDGWEMVYRVVEQVPGL